MTNYRNKCYFLIIMALMIFMLSTTVSFAYNDALTYKNLVGSNRYDTSVKVSKEAYPSGSKNVILVIGTSNVDGIVTIPLADKFSAPILLVQKDKIPTDVKNEIMRLKAKKVYLIGGSDVISNKVITELQKMGIVPQNIERVYGDTRVTTAIAIAKKMSNFNEIIVCNSRDGGENAAAIAAMAAQKGIPILYNDSTSSINSKTYTFIKNNASRIKKIYLVGNGISSAQQKELLKINSRYFN